MEKQAHIKQLYDKYSDEFKGREMVFGNGNADSELLLIGEAPGKDEVRLSKPFVGMAGKNLEEFLGVLGLPRDSIYITNAIKYRLSKVNPKTGRIINRPALKEDILSNKTYLHKEAQLIGARIIVTLGNVPLKALTSDFSASIGKLHGNCAGFKLGEYSFRLFPLYHPASIIYNRSLKEQYINDIFKLKEILEGFEH